MNQKKLVIIALGLLTIYGSFSNAKCDRPTAYKSSHYYTVYLTKPETTPDNFYLVLIGNNHSLYGGQAHTRINNEPIIEFKHYRSKNFLNPKLAFVHYRDFMDAINSDQPAHNVRVRSGDRYITLSKLFAREFRNGLASKTLNKIAQTGRL